MRYLGAQHGRKVPRSYCGHNYLTAALAMNDDMTAAVEARPAVLQVRPELSLAWMKENPPVTGEFAERVLRWAPQGRDAGAINHTV